MNYYKSDRMSIKPDGRLARINQKLTRGRVLPKDLTRDEVEILREAYGDNWFNELEYEDKFYERSPYDKLKRFNTQPIMSRVDNLAYDMRQGLKPEELTKDEVQLLLEAYGENWFGIFGFEGRYKRSKFDTYNPPPPAEKEALLPPPPKPREEYKSWADVVKSSPS